MSAKDERLVVSWNQRFPIGTKVIYTKDRGEVVGTATRSAASMLSGHTPVIWLENVSGCVLLTRVRPTPAPHEGESE